METKRENPLERREDPDLVLEKSKNCIETCPVAIRNHERIEAAFLRLDEGRRNHRDHIKTAADDMEDVRRDLGSRLKISLFMWVIGGVTAVYGSLLGVIWTHVNASTDYTAVTIEKIEKLSEENARKIDVTVTRINDFIRNNDQLLSRSQVDQSRMLNKLDDINNIIHKMQFDIGQIKRDR